MDRISVGTAQGLSTPPAVRALAPDLARGVMLALIAVANVMVYLHGRPYGLRQHIVEDGAVDRVVTVLLVTLVDARAYPLFAALFGYGLVRIADRHRRRGLDDAAAQRLVRRRSRWLVVIGFAHALLGFSGDILGWYGLLGLLLAGLVGVRDRVLLGLAAGSLLVASAVQGLVYADPQVRVQRSFLWSFAIEDPAGAAGWRLVEWAMTPFGLLSVVSPMLVGMWAARRGVLEHPEEHRTLLRRTAAIGVASGVLGGVGMALATAGYWSAPYSILVVLSWAHIATGVLCGLGYAALITLLAHRIEARRDAAMPRLVGALRATGERSLSCYLAQTVVFASLLPAWSLGWGADLGTAGAAALGLGTWGVTVVLAAELGRRGRRGPAEALLRHLTYSPARRAPSGATIN